MVAIECAKIFSQSRIPLETVLPLDTPYSVELDVCSVCNFRCKFCFQHDKQSIKHHGIKLSVMEMELYRKLITDMRQFPQKAKKLKLFEFGEPLLNPHLPEMIAYAKSEKVAEQIEITTNASLLSEDYSLSIINAGIDRINISLEAMSSSAYKKICGISVDFEKLVKNLEFLYTHKKNCVIYIKIADIQLSLQDRKLFFQIFGNICDEIFIEHISPIWRGSDSMHHICEDRTGSYGQAISEKNVCTFLFTRFVINSDGIVVACCVDWKRDMIIGDAKSQSLLDIWNGDALHILQIAHLSRHRKKLPLCCECNAFLTSTIDNVDNYADEILAKLKGELK